MRTFGSYLNMNLQMNGCVAFDVGKFASIAGWLDLSRSGCIRFRRLRSS